MRWLAIHLPTLPLEVYTRSLEVEKPLAVSESYKTERILLCNGPAARLGIHPGLPPGGALALAADLRILPRKPGAERAALERLAAWCGRFTSEVSLEPPQGLILEVARSLRLFGGAQRLLERVSAGVTGLGYRACCCLAHTPGGALVLAACGHSGVVAGRDALRALLVRLPLAALSLGERELGDLRRMGLHRLGDLLRLPRTGLAERLGVETIQRLERLLGEAPDPRSRFEPPPSYRGRLELPAELLHVDALLFPCRRLIDELGGFLLGRQAGVQRLEWCLYHGDCRKSPSLGFYDAETENSDFPFPSFSTACSGRKWRSIPGPHRVPSVTASAGEERRTVFTLGTAQPERDPRRWLDLLRERLGRLQLPEPVRAIGLDAREVQPRPPASLDLFPELDRPVAPDPGLLDRLRARLGSNAVHGLALVADHRPERAWRWCPPGTPRSGRGRRDRPLWLLPEPLPLQTRHRRPWWDGELDLGVERERIETGWWDGHEVARDYFVATTPKGERLWVYRELRGRRGWFLHGLFD